MVSMDAGLAIVLGLGVLILPPILGFLGYTFIKDNHKWKMALAEGGQSSDAATKAEVQALKEQIAEIRAQLRGQTETSTEFHLSLEASLHRLEQRLDSSTALQARVNS